MIPITVVVGEDVEVFLEGGIRRGLDVLKAIALGADAVMIGRPILWGLAAAGSEGVRRVLDLLAEELEFAMRMSGTPTMSRDGDECD